MTSGPVQVLAVAEPGVNSLGLLGANPTRGASHIAYELACAGRVRLTVLDLSGRVVATLVDGVQVAGSHHVSWPAGGASSPAGIYFARLSANGWDATQRIVQIR